MKKVSRAALAGVFGAGIFGVGCTAILGSFEVAPAGGAPDATDEGAAPQTDEGGVADASGSDAADAADGLLACAVVNVSEIDKLAAPGFDRFLSVFRAGNVVRVVTRHRGPASSEGVPTGARTYAFDPRNLGGGVTIGSFEGQAGVALDVRRVGQQLTVLAYEPALNGAVVVAWELPDAEPTKLSRRVISRQLADILRGLDGVTGVLGTYASPSEYFYAVSVPTPGIVATHGVFVGHVTANAVPGPMLVTNGPAGPGLAVSALARSAQGVFVFNAAAPSPESPSVSTGYVRVSEEPPHSPVPSFESIVPEGGERGMALFAAAGALPAGLKLAVSEVDLSGVGPPVVVRAGVLGPTDLAPFDATKLRRRSCSRRPPRSRSRERRGVSSTTSSSSSARRSSLRGARASTSSGTTSRRDRRARGRRARSISSRSDPGSPPRASRSRGYRPGAPRSSISCGSSDRTKSRSWSTESFAACAEATRDGPPISFARHRRPIRAPDGLLHRPPHQEA